MAYNRAGLKFTGGRGQAFDEGKMFIYTSSVDTLGTILTASYFDSISNDLDSEYLGIVKGTDGQMLVNMTSNGTVVSHETSTQALSGAGAADVVTRTTHHTSTGADAVTLADGLYVGQIKVYILIVDGGTSVVTPANALGWTTLTCADAGDSATLQWTTGGWALIGQGGLTTGPLTA